MLHSIFLIFRNLAFWYITCTFGCNYVFGFVSYFALLFSKNNKISKFFKGKKKDINPTKYALSGPVTVLVTHTRGSEEITVCLLTRLYLERTHGFQVKIFSQRQHQEPQQVASAGCDRS